MKNRFYATSLILSSLLFVNLNAATITATKLSDSQMNSSSTVDTFDEEKISEKQINNINDISNVISNVNITGIGDRDNKTFTFRGISNYVTLESSVAMYIDDIPVPSALGYSSLDMNNVSFLEVLKGAQGTLFGKNAESGVINLYTKPTTKNFKSQAIFDYASFNTKNIYLKNSGQTPIEKLFYMFSFGSKTTDGFTKNIITNTNFDRRDLQNFNAKLKYEINDNSDIKFNFIKSKANDGGTPFKINTKADPFNINNESKDDYLKLENDLISLVYTNKGENFKFTSASSYATQNVDKYNYIAITNPLEIKQDINIKEISQEFRLTYDYDKFNFLVGTFYSDKLKFNYKENQILPTFGNLSRINDLNNLDENLALFGQTRYWLNNNLSFVVGARYQTMKREFDRNLNDFLTPTLTYEKDTKRWNYFTPTLSMLYFTKNNSDIYTTFTKGYRPGGYNYRDDQNTLVPYKEEVTSSYELGYKSYGQNLNYSTVLFYNDIKDLRINTFKDDLGNETFSADEAYTYGAELSINYEKDKYKVESNLGFTKGKTKSFSSNPEYENKNIIDTPQFTANLRARYYLDKNYNINTTINHIGKRYYDPANKSSLGSYTTFNLGLEYKNKNLNTQIYANNIFDKKYNDFMIYTPSNNYYHFGSPRVFGVKLSYSF